MALPCGHAFHEACVNRFASCKGVPVEEACPMRCHLSFPVIGGHDESGASSDGGGEVVVEGGEVAAAEAAADSMN